MKSFKGKVVWITGASSGLGEALAYAFDRHESFLVLSARRETELERVKARCINLVNVLLLPMDMEKPDRFAGQLDEVIRKFGRLDILINNAGISQRSLTEETEESVYRKIMETNFFGPVTLSKLVLNQFNTQKGGWYVIISSLTGQVGLPGRTAYAASKHAAEGFWSAWATERPGSKTGIGITIVRPGAIRTAIAENALMGNGKRFGKKDPIIEKGIDATEAAEAILKGIKNRRHSLYIGSAEGRLLLFLNRWWPAMSRWASRRLNHGL